MVAVYDVISGPAGEKRDWDRMRSLFIDGARLIPTGRGQSGAYGHRVMTVEDYITGAGPWLEQNGFFEIEVSSAAWEEFTKRRNGALLGIDFSRDEQMRERYVWRTGRELDGCAAHKRSFDLRVERAGGNGLFGHDPNIGNLAAILHGKGRRIFGLADPGVTAGHDGPAEAIRSFRTTEWYPC